MGICRSLCHSFMRFVNVFSYEILQEDLLAWKVYYRILFLFLLLHMFPWINKFLIMENIFIPCLRKQESCRSLPCVFQSF